MQRASLAWGSRVTSVALALVFASLIASMDTALVFRLPSAFSSVNLPLVATLSVSLFWDREIAVWFGFAVGFVCDIALGNAVGARSIPLIVCAATVGLMENRLFREHPLTWMVLGIAGSILHDLTYFVTIRFAGYLPVIWADLVRMSVYGALINGFLSFVCLIPVYFWWAASNRKAITGLG